MEWTVIFDWDGVIVDSSDAHRQSWERLSRDENLPLPVDHMERGFGKKNTTIIPRILEWTSDPGEVQRISNRKETFYRELLAEGKGSILPGVDKLLRDLAEAQVPCVVGSSTDRENIEQAILQFGLDGLFKDIASAEDVDEGKPAPDVFLAAARKAGVDPSRCLVIEDAPYGIEAAHRAGMKAVGLLTSHSRETMIEADLIARDLSEITIPILKSLLNDS